MSVNHVNQSGTISASRFSVFGAPETTISATSGPASSWRDRLG